MNSHELAEKLLKLPNVGIKLSTHMSQDSFELSGYLAIKDDGCVKSIFPDGLFETSSDFDGDVYIELFAVKD